MRINSHHCSQTHRYTTMKSYIIITLALLAACSADDTYSTENDDLNIEEVVANIDKLKAFVDCFNDIGKCDAAPADFKKDIAEAVQQACAKCTDAQKHILRVFIEGLAKKLPAENTAFWNKYDPQNKYIAALKTAIANY